MSRHISIAYALAVVAAYLRSPVPAAALPGSGKYPARDSAETGPGARFIGYPGGGHRWVGHQQEVMSGIAMFLTSQPTGTTDPAAHR